MTTFTNTSAVPLSVAAYLASDSYDYIPNTVSATALLKPIRQRVLAARVPTGMAQTDIMSMVKSRNGTSIHDGVERVWTNPLRRRLALMSLGIPDSVISRIVVNSSQLLKQYGYGAESTEKLYMEDTPVDANTIPVFLEVRSFREHMGVRVSGKFDFVAEAKVEDVKTTGTFTWTNDTKSEDYQLQGSIYRWLNPKIIRQDTMSIQFFFTDWAAYRLKSEKNYPAQPVMPLVIPLLSLDATEAFITQRLSLFEAHKSSHEQDLPQCTDKELWRKEPVYKYYKGGVVAARSTKNYPTAREAHEHLMKDGGTGLVVNIPGEVVACKYCPAFPICTQKDQLIAEGSLIL
jgi:hypothetical protein